MSSILMLDAAGTPQRWLTPELAAHYMVKDLVAWSIGEPCEVLHGGTNALSGRQSTLELAPIIAVRGSVHASRNFRPLPCTRERVFARDRFLCAYCGVVYHASNLTVDHILPESRGGAASYTNLTSACKACNGRKDNRTPEEARMPLLYVPYEPNRHETFILSGRHILACQMEWLVNGVSANSRWRA